MTSSQRLPHLGDRLFLGDGGLETTMIYGRGIDLPQFASFLLLTDTAHRRALRDYYLAFLTIAQSHGLGFTLDTPTWRANADWGQKLGYSSAELAEVNERAVRFGAELRDSEETDSTPIAICGTLGPRGDAYHPSTAMSASESERYHAVQIRTFAESGADMVSAYTLSYSAEAVGIINAAKTIGLPVSISFTVETDGRLQSGESLAETIEYVDAETDRGAAYFMLNCAHPTHLAPALKKGGAWLNRLGGVRPNASRKSHAELDAADTLDSGDPVELGSSTSGLKPYLPAVRVLGGCCGTDERHVARICAEWQNARA